MYSLKSVGLKVLIAIMALASIVTVSGVYVTTPRDTSPAPEAISYLTDEPEGEPVFENDNFKYYIDEERDIITVYDKRNQYTWKTGLDLPFNTDIKDACRDIEDEFEDQFSNVPIDTELPEEDKYEHVFSTIIPELENAYAVTYDGVLEVRSRDLLPEYDDGDGNLTPATKEDLQVYFEGIDLEAGKTYQVSFMFNTNGTREYELLIGSEFSEVVSVEAQTNTVMELVTFSWTQTTAETDAQVVFNFGYFENSESLDVRIRMDNVAIYEFDGVDTIGDTLVLQGDFEIPEALYDVSVEELLEICEPLEERMNKIYTAFANSLLSIEYYNSTYSPFYESSASEDRFDVQSQFAKIESDGSVWRLEVDFITLEIQIDMYVTFTDNGIEYDVYRDDIRGEGIDSLAAIIIAPFQGASGGAKEYYDASNVYDIDYSDEIIFNDPIPGYILVPDGSGTLVRFNDYNVKLDRLQIQAYGSNPTQESIHRSFQTEYVPFKTLSLPLFGVAHGDNQAGFVAYATSGDEYMELEIWPEEYITYYTNAFPRFEYNAPYLQVYNRAGEGNIQLQDELNDFDIHMVYEYLDGTSTPNERADYVGMAMKYSEYLFGSSSGTKEYDDIPIRLDFLMSDSEKSLIGFINQVTTTSEGVNRILSDIMENGVVNINSGLLGWADGGITLGDPRDTDYTREIGTKREFETLISTFNEMGVDISLSQDYFWINEEIMRYQNNGAKHTNGWYATKFIWDYNLEQMYYARPVKSIDWLLDQSSEFDEVGVSSYTITGITNNLISDFTDDMFRNETKDIIVNGFSQLNQSVLVNAYQPNAYLLPYTDRYLQAPVYGTQYLIETDTVPFLQLVLQNNMEVYAPYANFSFYSDEDILRMIDYNVYPSFILTEQPAYLLTDTLSRNYYSTEYTLYEDLIVQVYQQVNQALQNTINVDWIARDVVEPGVIVNTYSDGTEIIINYTDEVITYHGVTVNPVSYEVN